MTVKELIDWLSKQPQDAPVFYDCPNCGRSNEAVSLSHPVLIRTKRNEGGQVQ